jgi:integration host factor subunit beta
MLKSELVSKLTKQNPHLYQRDIEQVVNAILDTISDGLAQGRRVELRGFGTFTVKRRDAHAGRNPRTGEAVSISEKVVPAFRTGKEMRLRLNPVPQKRAKKKSGAGAANVRGLVNA